MTTSATSRRAFLAGGAVAAGGLAIAGPLVHATATKVLAAQAIGAPRESVRDMGLSHSGAAAGQTMGWYMLDLPRPPGDTGLTGFDLAEP
jgi:hypothetical protein